MILKPIGDFSPENLDGISSGEVMPQTSAEAKAAAVRAGKSNYYWAGSTMQLSSADIAESQSSFGYPTATPQIIQDTYGRNPGEDLSSENLSGISSGEVMPQTRDEAFAAARRSRLAGVEGNDTFTWGGKSYHTKTRDDIIDERAAVGGISGMGSMGMAAPGLQAAPLMRRQSEFEGVMGGENVRKQNRQKRQEKRQGNRQQRQEGRQERRDDRKEGRAQFRQYKQDARDGYDIMNPRPRNYR